jgi:hypothetical protein
VSTGGGGVSRLEQFGAGAVVVVDGWFVAEAGIAERANDPDNTTGSRTRSDRRNALYTRRC